jgi:DNA-binding NarL/FixJ family response regulator
MNNNNNEIMKLSEEDKELVGLVAGGLTDDEIATQLQIPKRKVLNHIARLLAKLGAQDRVEIVLYAYSDSTMYQPVSTEAEVIPDSATGFREIPGGK